MITRLKYRRRESEDKQKVIYVIDKLAVDADNVFQILIDRNFNITFSRYPDYKTAYKDTAKSVQQAKRKVRKQLEKMGLVFGVEIRHKKVK